MPPSPNPYQFDPDDRRVIRNKIDRLVRRGRFDAHEGDEVEQELLLHLWKQLPQCSLARGNRRAFVVTLIDNALANYLRGRNAAKRHPGSLRSLDQPVRHDAERLPLGESLSRQDLDARCGRRASPEDAAMLAFDLAAVMARLPEHLRGVLERLLTMSVSEVAADMGVHRSTVYRWIDELREHLRDFDPKNQ